MPIRNRITYNLEGLFVGPAPATGFHYIDGFGFLHNDPAFSSLIYSIPRVQSFSYDINVDRTRVVGLGKAGTMANTIMNPPTVNLSFSYLNIGIIQDSRLGFYINYTSPYTNQPVFQNNFQVCLISGFLTRNIGPATVQGINWPLDYRDCRNVFVAITQDKTDLNYRLVNNVNVLGFGNCYITSYRTSAAIGDFPKTDVSYIGETMKFDVTGTAISIPSIDPKTYSGVNGVICSIPSGFADFLPTVLSPGDIIINISGNSADIGFDLTGVHIQSYEISMQFTRDTLNNVGYKAPMDRPIKLPVAVSFSFESILVASQSGNFSSLFRKDSEYNIDITIPYKRFTSGKVVYSLRRLKFDSMSSQNSIGSNRLGRFNFETELDPEDYSKGFFISGDLGKFISGFQSLSDTLGVISVTNNLLLLAGGGSNESLILENNNTLIFESAQMPIF